MLKDAKIAPLEKRATSKNLTLIGTKKKIITTIIGAKNGISDVEIKEAKILLVLMFCFFSKDIALMASMIEYVVFPS